MQGKGLIVALKKVLILYEIKVSIGMQKNLQWITSGLQSQAFGTGHQNQN
jgi:hypothetical protein